MTIDREQLSNFSILSTDDPEELRQRARLRYGHEFTQKPGDYFVNSNFAQLPSFAIFHVKNTAGARLRIEKSISTHVHLFLDGRCTLTIAGQRHEIAADQAFVCTSGQAADVDYGPYEELVVMVPPATLERVFASLTGIPPQCSIAFEPMLDSSNPRYGGFRDLVMMLAGRVDPALSAWSQATLEQLEFACVTSLLYCGRHNLSHLLDPTPCADLPRHIRIAEHFVDVNAEHDISIDDMAKASAVSTSTLTRAFLKYRDCTPATYIKRARLARARTLLESRAVTTVVGVALRCGFSNPSRFGRDYAEAFGETPAQTLRRLRAQPDA